VVRRQEAAALLMGSFDRGAPDTESDAARVCASPGTGGAHGAWVSGPGGGQDRDRSTAVIGRCSAEPSPPRSSTRQAPVRARFNVGRTRRRESLQRPSTRAARRATAAPAGDRIDDGAGGVPARKMLVASMFPLSNFTPSSAMKSSVHSYPLRTGFTVTSIAFAI
jgi:hypothetical protein